MDDQARDRGDTEDRTQPDDGGQDRSGASTEGVDLPETTVETESGQAAASAASDDAVPAEKDKAQDTASSADPHDHDGDDKDEERRNSANEFAREHDPAKHDISAGQESRQMGDWTAEEAGGPQVWDADGNLLEGTAPGAPQGGRTSALEEVRDGGYGVGSAAIIDDGAIPLGHPVKAWEDTKTFVAPDHPSYGAADPHLWFTDADAAQNAGFSQIA